MSCAVLILAKLPVPGAVKTRLIPALGAEGAARLAERMLAHSITEAIAAQIGPVELCLDVPPEHPDAQRWRAYPGVTLGCQGEGDLGERMQRALARALAHSQGALLIGTDLPGLGRAELRAAAQTLATHDVVFLPTEDGGYGLVGLTAGVRLGL
ncbi:MAG: TIGR04282 family arsenosugar biosynthesis glycosyltransferase, partial [Casimicrobiaceae bacterium]